MSAAPDDFAERLRSSGITPDKPLYAVLMTVHESALAAREAVQWADVGKAAAGAVRYELSSLHKVHLLRTGVFGAGLLLAACGIGLGVGFALGHSHGAVGALTARCQGAALQQKDGRLACSFWMQEPPASGAMAGRR